MTISEAYTLGRDLLKNNGITDYSAEAMFLLEFVFSVDSAKYLFMKNEEANEQSTENYFRMLDRRITGEPVQYIIGEWDFCSRKFFIGDGVLIPRPETEQLCDIADNLIKQRSFKVVYDLCTGSGCIGITLALNNPDTRVYLFELYDTPCRYTECNIKYHGADNAVLIKHDVLCGVNESLPAPDMIISNPPYIPSDVIPGLSREVLREPKTALDGGNDGLVFYRAIARSWLQHLNTGGICLLECGENQAVQINDLFKSYMQMSIINDMYNAERFVFGYKNKTEEIR